MAIPGQQIINIGLPNESANSDSLFVAFNKTKNNFANLFACASPYVNFISGNGISTTSSSNTGTVLITNTGVTGINAGPGISVTGNTGNITIAAGGNGIGNGTVQYVGVLGASNGARITTTGSPIIGSGNITLDLANSGVNAGTYTTPIVTVDTYGRITDIANGVGVGTVTSIGLDPGPGISIVGGPITGAGTITVTNTGVTQIRAGRGILISNRTGNGVLTISTTPSTGTVTSVDITSTSLNISGSPITSAGTITIDLPSNISILGNLVAGNLVAPLANGNSNIRILTGGGNLLFSANGTANVMVVTKTGANITGTANISGITNIAGNLNFTGSKANLGSNANVRITGGSAGQILSTDGAGNLSWAASGGSGISNGSSNVSIPIVSSNINLTVAGTTRLVVTNAGANITGTGNVTGTLSAGNVTTDGNSTVGANTRIYQTPGYTSLVGSVLTGRLLGSYSQALSSNYFFDYNQSNTISSADANLVGNIGTVLDSGVGESNAATSFGTSFGNRNAGLSFISGTKNDITRVASSLAPLYTGNINAVVLGYSVNGPRIITQDRSLIDDSANTISHIAEKHILYNGSNTTAIATFTAANTTVTGNIILSGNLLMATRNITAGNITVSTTVTANLVNSTNVRTSNLYNSTSNIKIAAGGNVTVNIAGNTIPRMTIASNVTAFVGNVTMAGVLTTNSDITATGNVNAALDIVGGNLETVGHILTSGGPIGYDTGAGAGVTQVTSRTTDVTINAYCGTIELVSAAGNTSFNTFTVYNDTVGPSDVIIVNQAVGADQYMIFVTNVTTGSFDLTYATTGGTNVEQPAFNFAVIRGVSS